jgi:hypothetical protein
LDPDCIGFNWVQRQGCGSKMFIPDPDFFPHLGSWIQGSKKHRISDPDP